MFDKAWLESHPRQWLCKFALRQFKGGRWGAERASALMLRCGLVPSYIGKTLAEADAYRKHELARRRERRRELRELRKQQKAAG